MRKQGRLVFVTNANLQNNKFIAACARYCVTNT